MFKPSDMSGATSDITMESVAEESSSSDSMIDEDEKEKERVTNKDAADYIDVDVIGVYPLDIEKMTNPTPKKSINPYPLGKYEKNESIKSAVSPMK